MPRWDCDGVLYRIFCVTLLSIAVLSTIVLINVVIDIEGVKNISKVKPKTATDSYNEQDGVEAVFIQDDARNNADKEALSYDDETDEYRTKRSLEIPNYLNKKSLTNRLATLLEELDEEEEADNVKSKQDSHVPETKDRSKIIENNKKGVQIRDEEERLHSIVHDLILEGLAKHSRLENVYEKIHKIVENFQGTNKIHTESKTKKTEVEDITYTRKNIFSDEIIHCKTLHEDILKAAQKPKDDQIIKKGLRLIINTVIDILPASENIPKTEGNVKEFLKVIYNKGANTDENNDDSTSRVLSSADQDVIQNETVNVNDAQQTIPKAVISQIFEEYYNKNKEGKSKENVKQKRMKRHVKIRYEPDSKTTKKPKNKKSSVKDDELFVEIETHFDSKGLKGEKKKKLIRELIDKIQKAIHNETMQKVEKKTKHKHLHVKKRMQSPLDHKSKAVFINKLSIPFQSINHRKIDPISKSFPVSEPVPLVDSKSGENWRIKYTKPNFLSPSKGINSAELSIVDTDYNRVMEVNGIPQRLQKPINTDGSEEIPNTYLDLGKLKFFVKDIAGSGFSVGFNQYEDTAPDAETMKLFTGLENILQNYHQDYDLNNQPVTENFEGVIPEVEPSNIEHVVAKRSIEKDYHSNEYKLIFDSNYMPFSDYKEIFRKRVSNNGISKEKQTLVLDRNIFDKTLKPAEIFRLAELIREKRSSNKYHVNSLERKQPKKILRHFHTRENHSLKVKKISNLKNKIKLNRYLNTKPMSTKRIFMTKKRSKRQIGKIRIIASDSGHNPIHSEEDIFVVSDEKIFADRAIVRDINNVVTPNIEPMVQEPIESDKEINYDYNIAPYVYEQTPYHSIYSKSIRNNALMSKYPHILLEEIGRSKDYELPYSMMKVVDSLPHEHTTAPIELNQAIVNSTSPAMEVPAKISDIVNAIAPKSNYKLTVKILPKNTTDINSGYKEIHTIINNSFNRDGLQYSSLVNMSEISKVIKLNKTTESSNVEETSQSPVLKNMIETQNKMKYLLEQHKERINAQLVHLNQEKEKLDSLLINNETDFDAYADQNFDYDVPTQVNTTEKNNIPNVRNSIHQTGMTQQTTEAQQILKPTTKVDGFRLVNSIERNENLTTEVLKKIDRNTDLLQTFLQKVISALDFTKANTLPTKIDISQSNKESNTDGIFKHDMSNPKDINPAEFFSKTVPNLEISVALLLLELSNGFGSITNVKKKKYLPIKRKTNGMNLTNGKGYVWNDVTAPKVLYHVGEKEPDKVEETYANDQGTSNSINIKTTTTKTSKSIPDSDLADIINGLDDTLDTFIRKNHTDVLQSKNNPKNTIKAENVTISPNIILKDNKTKPTGISNIIDDLKDIYNTLKINNIMVTTTKKSTISTTPDNNDIIVKKIVKPTTSTKLNNRGVVARTTNKTTTLTTLDKDGIIATTTEKIITTPINHKAKVIDVNELKHTFSDILPNISNTNEFKKSGPIDTTHPSNVIVSKPIKNTTEVSNISNEKNRTAGSHTDRAARGSDPDENNNIKTNDNNNTRNNRTNRNNSDKENKYRQDGVRPSFLENLIKNDYFWKWLNVLTSKYLDMLMNRITEIIKAEVASQIEYYLKHNNITTGQPNCTKTGNYITESSNNNNNIKDESNKSNTINFEVPTNIFNEKNGTYLNNSTNVLNNIDRDNNTNAQETNGTKPAEVIHKDSGTAIVNNTNSDNKKLGDHISSSINIHNYITSTNISLDNHKINNTSIQDVNETKFVDDIHKGNATQIVNLNSDNINNSTKTNVTLDKHKKNNISVDKIKDAPVKFNAQTIYGNSIGNEKVTNIYIFKVNNVSDINDLKPASTALTGFFTLGPHQNIFITDDNNSTTSQTTKTDHETVIPNDMKSNNSILSHNDETVTATDQINIEKSTNEPTTTTSQPITSSETTTIATTPASR
ncbi:hypothetical protein K1T71_000971 [Dendrolimus kikuchii]|uniref:Uncharacterized protein n=1 Tax=Dendrolimus kikuchii TaxID=765133 RepID=A0ACC1DGQ7_9NEOP|nr:hypothetical protein K1T71_000971 [Dendrolimus kikuchii]